MLGYHQHPNGGGWVRDGVEASPDAYIASPAIVHGGEIRGGDIRDGVIHGGAIWGGVIHGGAIWGGVIHGGAIWGGVIYGGAIWGGVIHGGDIHGGVIWGGDIRGGDIRGGVIWGGDIRDGVIHGGAIRGGVVRGGVVRGGVVREGTWCHDHLSINFSRYVISHSRPGHATVGCTELTFAEWRKQGDTLIRREQISKQDASEIGMLLRMIERRDRQVDWTTGKLK
jgi:hypothetical protein